MNQSAPARWQGWYTWVYSLSSLRKVFSEIWDFEYPIYKSFHTSTFDSTSFSSIDLGWCNMKFLDSEDLASARLLYVWARHLKWRGCPIVEKKRRTSTTPRYRRLSDLFKFITQSLLEFVVVGHFVMQVRLICSMFRINMLYLTSFCFIYWLQRKAWCSISVFQVRWSQCWNTFQSSSSSAHEFTQPIPWNEPNTLSFCNVGI